MTKEQFKALLFSASDDFNQLEIKFRDDDLVLLVNGGEIIFHSFTDYGSGEWSFIDTCD